MKLPNSKLAIALGTAGLLSLGALATLGNDTSEAGAAVAAQGAVPADPRLALPANLDRALKSEVEGAATSEELEEVLARHPDQGQFLVPRIEALALREIRREGAGDRLVIPGLEPDEGEGNSVTLQAGDGRTVLTTEFPGDTKRVRFSDGSVHRFVGQFPFADVLTIYGDGDKDHRLTFAVLDELGMVYVRGKGRVVTMSDGKEATVQLGVPQ